MSRHVLELGGRQRSKQSLARQTAADLDAILVNKLNSICNLTQIKPNTVVFQAILWYRRTTEFTRIKWHSMKFHGLRKIMGLGHNSFKLNPPKSTNATVHL